MDKFLQEISDPAGKQISERITNIEKKFIDMDEKYENRNEELVGAHVDRNQGKAVMT